MSTVPTPLRRIIIAGALAAWLALALTPFASGTEPALQIGYIRGRLVHLRESPPQESLAHDTVLRHLKPGDVFVTDGVRTGISHTGKDTGAWFHVHRLDDPKVSGWIAARYLVLIPGAYLDTDESLRAIAAARDAQEPSAADSTAVQNHAAQQVRSDERKTVTVPQHSYLPPSLEKPRALFAPIVDFLSDVFSILDNVVNLFALVLTFGMGRWMINRFGRTVGAALPGMSSPQNTLCPAPPQAKARYLYFEGFHIRNR